MTSSNDRSLSSRFASLAARGAAGFFALLLASACSSEVTKDDGDGGGGGGCVWNGETHAYGESFPDEDGCNMCSCEEDGTVGCTLKACVEDCTYQGKTHPFGTSFPAADGCNTCTCDESGVACTEIACACDPAAEWWREYAAEDPETCEVIDFGCPENTTAFSNDCGCGCEQSSECPQTFDCMPPKSCDFAAIAKECPYSTIAM